MTVRDIIMGSAGSSAGTTYPSNNLLLVTDYPFYIGKSTDAGATWTTAVGPVTAFSAGDLYGYTTANDRWLLALYNVGRYRVPLSGSATNLANESSPYDLLAIPGTNIVLGFGGGYVKRSTDGGTIFTNVFLPDGGFGTFVSCAIYFEGIIFYSTVDTSVSPRQQYHYRSTDLGLNWTRITSGLPYESLGGFGSGFGWYKDNIVFISLPSDSQAYAQKIYISLDNGLTWTTFGNINSNNGYTPSQNNYGDTGPVPFYNEGAWWSFVAFGNPGVWRSTDLIDWTLWYSPPSGYVITSLAAIPGGLVALCCLNDGINYQGTYVFKRMTGDSWQYLSNPVPSAQGYPYTLKNIITLNTPGR